MKQYKNNTVTKTQRVIACLLLLSQLLTSCPGITQIEDGNISNTDNQLPQEVQLEVAEGTAQQNEEESEIHLSMRSASVARSNSSKSTSRRESETKKFASLAIEDKTRMLLEALYDSDECIYFSTDRFFKKLQEKKPERAKQIIQEFIRLQQKHKLASQSEQAAYLELTGNKLYGSILLIREDDNPQFIPIKNKNLTAKEEQRIDEDVNEVRKILETRYNEMKQTYESLNSEKQDLEEKIKKYKVVGNETLWDKLSSAINGYIEQCGECDAINKDVLLAKINSLGTYKSLENYLDNSWLGFRSQMGYPDADQQKRNAIDKLRDLIRSSVIDITQLECLRKKKTESEILKGKLNKVSKLGSISAKEISIARGHSESVLLENMDFDQEDSKSISGEKFKRAYILLLSTNVICSACSNVVPAIRGKLVAKLEAVGGKISENDIDLLYLPIKDQGVKEEDQSEKAGLGESSIGKVVVKLNDKEENYTRKSNSITSTKSKNEALAILFDKAFGSDIHQTYSSKDIELSRSDNFESLHKQPIGETYSKDKGSPKGKSHKSGSSR